MIFKKPMYQAPLCLQKMNMTIQKHSLVVKYRPGKDLIIEDTLSWAFVPVTADDIMSKKCAIQALPISEAYWLKLEEETLQD